MNVCVSSALCSVDEDFARGFSLSVLILVNKIILGKDHSHMMSIKNYFFGSTDPHTQKYPKVKKIFDKLIKKKHLRYQGSKYDHN